MNTKRFVAADMSRALTLVREELGDDAMILSTQRSGKNVEIVATAEELPSPTVDIAATTMAQTLQDNYGPDQQEKGLASGKTKEELALEMEMARRRMMAIKKEENMTLAEWAEKPADYQNKAFDSRPTEVEQSQFNQWLRETASTNPSQKRSQQSAQQFAQKPAQESPSKLSQLQYQAEEEQRRQQQEGQQDLREQQALLNQKQEQKQPQKQQERDNEEIRRLHDEIASMRERFESQLMFMEQAQERRYQDQQALQDIVPIVADVKQQLEQLGLTRACNDDIVRSLKSLDDSSMNKESLWAESLARLSRKIPVIDTDPVATGGIYAFLGTTGVGKTTTIAKLAARYVMEHGSDEVVLLTTDVFRIAAHDQLRSLGRILNVQVKVVDDIQQLPSILTTFSKQALVLIDTPGMSYNDPLLKQHLTALRQCRHVQTALVLSANSQYQMMQASVHSYRIAKPRFCVMTKLDECASLGGAISLLASNNLPLAYITNGQAVPDDLSVVKPHQLVANAVKFSKMAVASDHQPKQG